MRYLLRLQLKYRIFAVTTLILVFNLVCYGYSFLNIYFMLRSKLADQKELFSILQNEFMINLVLLFLTVIGSFWLTYKLGRDSQEQIDKLAEGFTKDSKNISELLKNLTKQYNDLSDAATDQATTLEQTITAVEEISSMARKTSDSADRSKTVSQNSRSAVEKGKQRVNNMMSAMDEIEGVNYEIEQQMTESNGQLSNINRLISDISSKTKVINEIVFQTKLLSFNASVEAARAGEAGKGFSVVAEEVGNLARMSGTAAKEISNLLQESIGKVDSIAKETKSKVDALVAKSKQKVKQGNQTASDCNSALEEILDNVSSVDNLVNGISSASGEQAIGIKEISSAVSRLDEVTCKNLVTAQETSTHVGSIEKSILQLENLINELNIFASGDMKKMKKVYETGLSNSTNIVSFEKSLTTKTKGHDGIKVEAKSAVGSELVPSSDDPGFGD